MADPTPQASGATPAAPATPPTQPQQAPPSQPARPPVRAPGFNASPEFGQLAGALAKAQGKFTNPPKNCHAEIQMRAEKGGGSYGFDYADLAGVLSAIREPLATSEVALLQPIVNRNGSLYLVTLLVHSSGQWMSCELYLGPEELEPRQLGIKITYARRYGLSSLAGVASEDDRDIEGMHEEQRPPRRREQSSPPRERQGPPPEQKAPAPAQKPAQATTPPADGPKVVRWPYKLAAGILRNTPAGLEEVDASKLDAEQLRAAAEEVTARGKDARAKGQEGKLQDALRDFKVIDDLLTKLTDAGDASKAGSQKPPAGSAAPAESAPKADPPAAPPANPPATVTEPRQGEVISAPPANSGKPETPKPAEDPATGYPAAAAPETKQAEYEVPEDAAHLGCDVDVSGIKAIDKDERALLLAGLSDLEVVAMALHPGNQQLFNDAVAAEVAAVTPADVEPITPLWLLGPWLECHELDKDRRRLARKLLRIAIAVYKLGSKADAKAQPALNPPPKAVRRPMTDDEREHVDQLTKHFRGRTVRKP